jgi:diadenosine tetraphosphate (Ap4A) HIT family hydrolase
MPDQNAPEPDNACPFCNRPLTQNTFLHEGRDFFIIADHAPLAEAHLLLIPRHHFPHLAALPPDLDAEFEELKAMVGDFVKRNYGSLTYWENGVFGQSVPHAHLHALSLSLDPALYVDEGPSFDALTGLRERFAENPSPYFVIEHDREARLLPPDRDLYRRIIQYASQNHGGQWLLTRDDRRTQGQVLVQALKTKWEREFAVP